MTECRRHGCGVPIDFDSRRLRVQLLAGSSLACKKNWLADAAIILYSMDKVIYVVHYLILGLTVVLIW